MITVEEIKAKCPEADVYVLDPTATHLVVLSKRGSSPVTSKQLGDAIMQATGHYPIILRVDDTASAIKLLEVK